MYTRKIISPKHGEFILKLDKQGVAIFDAASSWSIVKKTDQITRFYAMRARDFTYLHKLILIAPKGHVIDHANGDTLDNRFSNLRIATTAQNNMNRCRSQTYKGKALSSKYKGVSWDKSRNKWIVHVSVNNRQKYLGRFVDEIEAAKAYNKAAKQHYGEFARLNKI